MKIHALSLKVLSAVCLALAMNPMPAPAQTKQPPAAGEHVKYALEVTADGVLLHEGRETSATLGHAIDILRQVHPERTFALSPGLSEVKLSELKLHANDVDQTLEALRLACGNRFVIAAPSHMPDKPDAMRTLYLLQGDEPRNRRRTVEAFNLGPWISGAGNEHEKERRFQRLEEIIMATIVQLKQSPLEAADRPEMLFHQEANIIVVIGAPEAIEVAGKIIRAVNPGMAMNPGVGMSGMGMGSQSGGIGNNSPLPQGQPGLSPNPFGGSGSTTPVPNKPGDPPR